MGPTVTRPVQDPLAVYIKQVFLLYHWGSLATLELISLIPSVGSLEENPLAVKLLDNRLYIFIARIMPIV